MAKEKDKSGSIEPIRIGVRLPSIPLPIKSFTRRKIHGLKLQDLEAHDFQTPLVSIEQAANETLLLLKKYKARIDQDARVVRELLQLNPYFIRFQWVADAADQLEKSQQAKRARGRPKWRYTIYPEVVLGLVWVLRASGEARSNREAAEWLEISGLFSSTRVLRLLKQARKDPRLEAMLSAPPDTWPDYTENDLRSLYDDAVTPEEGQILRFEKQGNHFRYIGARQSVDQPCEDDTNT